MTQPYPKEWKEIAENIADLAYNGAVNAVYRAVIAAMQQAAGGAQKDAERYRWLRGPDHESTRYSRWRIEYWAGADGWEPTQKERMDAAIDAAMKEG